MCVVSAVETQSSPGHEQVVSFGGPAGFRLGGKGIFCTLLHSFFPYNTTIAVGVAYYIKFMCKIVMS